MVQGREVRKFVLNPTVTTIGRAQDNDIVINNLALSRRHAEVHLRRGRFEVEDKGSQNGVFVNNGRIEGPMALKNADTITLGTYQFVFSDDEGRDPDIKGARSQRRASTQLEEDEAPAPPPPASRAPVEADDGPVPLLVLKYNDMELQRFPLQLGPGDECVVGRGKDCGIQIAERRLSRRHCAIQLGKDGFIVRDLGSQNGTYVNRRRIPGTYALRDGDILNFAEYSVHFLADVAAYDGPDQDPARPIPVPRPMSDIEREETAFPEAYGEGQQETPPRPSIVASDRLEPSDMSDPDIEPRLAPVSPMPNRGKDRPPLRGQALREDPRDPFVERPQRAMERRSRPADPPPQPPPKEPMAGPSQSSHAAHRAYDGARRGPAIEPKRRDPAEPLPPTGPIEYPDPKREGKGAAPASKDRPRPKEGARPSVRPVEDKTGKPRKVAPAVELHRHEEPEHHDVADDGQELRPDEALDDWFKARDEQDDEEPSVLLERSKSSMSQILSTMMVDKRELDKNLAVRAKQRRFVAQVTWGKETIYAGPLNEAVTILGTDKDSDIKLKGRYVAGRHSLLVRVRDSLLLVRLGSSSAARVNGLPKLQAFLRSGDVIQIDETVIRIIEE
ncbi:MAG: FHA domain-containing protein [Deltaproteobacteria bacterium]|nr:FHA domain-containing protein [Deltaproteobacteria bacterium]